MTTPLDVKLSPEDAEVLRQYQRDVGQTVRDAEIRAAGLETQLAEMRSERDDARGALRVAERERNDALLSAQISELRNHDLHEEVAELRDRLRRAREALA